MIHGDRYEYPSDELLIRDLAREARHWIEHVFSFGTLPSTHLDTSLSVSSVIE
jgi:hypothetical protein